MPGAIRSGAGRAGRALQGEEAGLAQTDPTGGQPEQGLGDRGEVRVVADDQAVAAGLRIYLDFGLENPDADRVAFMIEGPHGRVAVAGPVDESDVSVPGHTAFDILRRMIADLHRRGLGAGDDPERMAQSVWAGMHGLVSLLIARPGFPWAEREALVAGHVRMLADMAMRRD